jgi:cell wall-associated NlpC family hydrolase
MQGLRIGLIALALLLPLPAPADETGNPPDFTTSASQAAGSVLGQAQEFALRALSFIGVRYQWGGTSPDTGFDCSGLIRYVYAQITGQSLPYNAHELSRVGETVDRSELQPGDLVFFNTLRKPFSHVGIYLGESRFVHAPSRGGSVEIVDMSQRYWKSRYNGARRLPI